MVRWKGQALVEVQLPDPPGGDTTPSCANRPRASKTVRRSVILPPDMRKMVMLAAVTSLPVAGMPMNSRADIEHFGIGVFLSGIC